MKIKIAIIPSEHASKAQEFSVKLQNAMEAGEMRIVDQTTKKLLSLTDEGRSLSVSEVYWNQLIEQVRSFDENFKSDYIMVNLQLEKIIEADVTESFREIVSLVEHALQNGCDVLQLPYEEEGHNV